MKKQYYLTQERLEQLKKELEEYKTTRRREVADRLKRAKDLGDLSENAEYTDAREEQTVIEARIAELDDMVRNAVIIKHGGEHKVVEIGSTVIVERDGVEMRYTIVGSNESKPEQGFISNESPLGKAFLEKKPGDTVMVTTPGGESTYKIIKIE